MNNQILRFKVGDYVVFDIDKMDPAYSPWLFSGTWIVLAIVDANPDGDKAYLMEHAKDKLSVYAYDEELIPADAN